MVSVCSLSPIICLIIFTNITCYADHDYYQEHRGENVLLSRTSLDTSAIYEGVMSPENIIVGIIQNFIAFLTSSIGWAFILPFYKVIRLSRSALIGNYLELKYSTKLIKGHF